MDWKPTAPALQALLAEFLRESPTIYLVGGYVRDTIANWIRTGNDLDIVVQGAAIPTAKRVADRLGWAYFPLDNSRDTARLVFRPYPKQEFVCDVTSVRGETIEADLYNRDFTINALAVELFQDGSSQLIDVSGGLNDIESRTIRRVTAYGLAEDAQRLLRAVRLAAQFDLELEAETRRQIARLSGTIRTVSAERIRDELWKMMTTTRPDVAVGLLATLGLLSHVLPEVAATIDIEQSHPHTKSVFEHTLSTMQHAAELRTWIMHGEPAARATRSSYSMVESTLQPWRLSIRKQMDEDLAFGRSRDVWLIWSALLHDIGKPATQVVEAHSTDGHQADSRHDVRYRFPEHPEIGAQKARARLQVLQFSRHELTYMATVVRNHVQPLLLHAGFINLPINARAKFRYFRACSFNRQHTQVGLDILLLALCEYQAIYDQSPPPGWQDYLQHIVQLVEFGFRSGPYAPDQLPPLVDGNMLIRQFDRPAGPWIGAVLEHLREAQISGEISTRDEALTAVQEWLAREGKDQ